MNQPLRCIYCARIGRDEPATAVELDTFGRSRPVCHLHATIAFDRSWGARPIDDDDQATLPQPKLAPVSRWKEVFGRNRPRNHR